MAISKKEFLEEEEHKSEAAGMMRWLLTYADMITLLLGTFIVIVGAQEAGKFDIIAQQAAVVFKAKSIVFNGSGKIMPGGGSILPYFKPQKPRSGEMEEEKDSGVKVQETELGIFITISSGIMFDSGMAQLKPDAKKLIDAIYHQYVEGKSNQIVIKGHTDDKPISTAVFPSNWELSTGRAGAVARYMISNWGVSQQRLTTAGYADTKPVAPNDTPQNCAINRRVEIYLLKGEANRIMGEMNKKVTTKTIGAEQPPANQEQPR